MNISRRVSLCLKREELVMDMYKVTEHIREEDFAPAIPITHLMAAIQDAGSQEFSSIDIQHAFNFSPFFKKW